VHIETCTRARSMLFHWLIDISTPHVIGAKTTHYDVRRRNATDRFRCELTFRLRALSTQCHWGVDAAGS